MKKQVFLLVALFSTLQTMAGENPFEKFIGSYEVVSVTCSPDKGCDQTEIRLESEGTDRFRIYEVSPGATVGHPIYLEEDIRDGYTITAKITSPYPESAAWIFSLSLKDGRTQFERRLIMRDGANYLYTLLHREKPLFGKEWTVQRRYVLKAK